MKLRTHFIVQVVLFFLLLILLGIDEAFIIVFFHFIPTIDYIMKLTGLHAELHSKLFHNVFVIILSSLIVFYLTDPLVASLATLNLVMHIVMDLKGKGIYIFYPVSDYRLKLW